MKYTIFIFFLILQGCLSVQNSDLDKYNVVWNSESLNSSESVPCGGGDIGLNVWVENGELLFYISRSGVFDENNQFPKLGRVRVKLSPNLLDKGIFSQELVLKDGYVAFEGNNGQIVTKINVWVDVYRPVIHVDVESDKKIEIVATYESWRYRDRLLRPYESFSNSYKWATPEGLKTLKDEISFDRNSVLFYHRNTRETIFDVTVSQQKMGTVKNQLFNPLKNLTYGGLMEGENMIVTDTTFGKYLDTDFKGWELKSASPSKNHSLTIYLNTQQTESVEEWKAGLDKIKNDAEKIKSSAWEDSKKWWHQFWQRSFVFIQHDSVDEKSHAWQMGRNYQLFRYMLGCNAFGTYPTKFNGGLFTYDPVFTDSTRNFTPDFRNWGGGTFTAQNQRLVYFPMLKCGDFDLMKPQLDFYMRILKNAEIRSEVYWGHKGACFTEQIENFGLPNPSEYGWNRPDGYDPGMQYNNWLEYQWDTALEFAFMMLEMERYTNQDISEFIPFIESCLTFFDKHYKFLAKKRGEEYLDQDGHLIFYPCSACETYKMAYNSTSTIAALKTLLKKLLELPEEYQLLIQRERWQKMLSQIPPITFREFDGHKTISPAKSWERINNTECPQLYPVYPWGIYGIGKPDLDIAINTFKCDTDAVKFRSYISWKQDNIFAARLGLTEEASKLTVQKLQDSGRRFPAFWGPGFDWVPDHNWGGSGMIGLQEMLMQTDGDNIYLFPAWPKEWDVHFKFCAPHQTIVECQLKDGEIILLKVEPQQRESQIVIF